MHSRHRGGGTSELRRVPLPERSTLLRRPRRWRTTRVPIFHAGRHRRCVPPRRTNTLPRRRRRPRGSVDLRRRVRSTNDGRWILVLRRSGRRIAPGKRRTRSRPSSRGPLGESLGIERVVLLERRTRARRRRRRRSGGRNGRIVPSNRFCGSTEGTEGGGYGVGARSEAGPGGASQERQGREWRRGKGSSIPPSRDRPMSPHVPPVSPLRRQRGLGRAGIGLVLNRGCRR
mmetsp:Transcript_44952/g.137289  ORF Transcript_44952/g.137289 Transcript_44952/m.137289 type:complete len:230 (+) Transcript_44952:529-1218(+)